MNEDSTPNESAPSMPALWGWRTWASMAIGLSVLVILAWRVDFAEVWREIRDADLRYALLGGFAHYLTYFVRGRRWKKCLRHISFKVTSLKFGLVVFFYNWVDNIVPAKLGDLYAAHMARINFGIKRSQALGSIVFLRMIDAWVVLLLAAVSSWALFHADLPKFVGWSLIGGVAMALAATAVMVVFVFLKKKTPAWVPERFHRMIRDFREGMQPSRRYFLEIAFLTVCIWTLETLWIYCLTLAFGLTLGPVTVLFLTTLSLLASIFPFTPSGAGAVEVTIFVCLRLVNVPVAIATSLTVLNRVIDYWLHIVLGLLTFAVRKKLGLHTWREVPVTKADLAEEGESR